MDDTRRRRWGLVRGARIAAVALALVAGAGDARTFTRVAIPSLDRDAAGVPVSMQALLLLPDGPVPPGGFPAIVALHGCSGLYSNLKGHEERLGERLMARADMLLSEGYALLFPDSFRSRGRQEVCTIKAGESSVPAAKRKLDALGALAYLAQRRDIARDRIALVGWSHGGSATLATINARDREVNAFRERPDAPPFFRAAVAFYPGCRASLAAGERWETAIPTRILIGALDDWTPARDCEAMMARRSGEGAPLRLIVYPGAYHAFNARSLIGRPREVFGGHHVEYNEAADTAAWSEMTAALRQAFGR